MTSKHVYQQRLGNCMMDEIEKDPTRLQLILLLFIIQLTEPRTSEWCSSFIKNTNGRLLWKHREQNIQTLRAIVNSTRSEQVKKMSIVNSTRKNIQVKKWVCKFHPRKKNIFKQAFRDCKTRRYCHTTRLEKCLIME